ncbi:hypothetical protein FHS40_002094 [Streptomyces spectabilis]|uniref:Uncharacterized protein n=1 Tax=Streptomyces spectabilis TaxID=68270 RepID=A0A7W8AS71_STRST|nr:hypothetical protein [Streptomyces spectabilis]
MVTESRSSEPGCCGVTAVIAGVCCLAGALGLLALAYVLSL